MRGKLHRDYGCLNPFPGLTRSLTGDGLSPGFPGSGPSTGAGDFRCLGGLGPILCGDFRGLDPFPGVAGPGISRAGEGQGLFGTVAVGLGIL